MVLKCMKYPASGKSDKIRQTSVLLISSMLLELRILSSFSCQNRQYFTLTSAFSQECVILCAHTALGMDPVSIIRGGLDHSTDAGVLKGALVQQGEWTSWGRPGVRIWTIITKFWSILCLADFCTYLLLNTLLIYI